MEVSTESHIKVLFRCSEKGKKPGVLTLVIRKMGVRMLFFLSFCFCLAAREAKAQTPPASPTPPTNLTYGDVTSSSLRLTWTAVTDGTANGYLILGAARGNSLSIPEDGDPIPTHQPPFVVVLDNHTMSTYEIERLTRKTQYTFRILSYRENTEDNSISYGGRTEQGNAVMVTALSLEDIVDSLRVSKNTITTNTEDPELLMITQTVTVYFDTAMSENSSPRLSISSSPLSPSPWAVQSDSWTNDSTFIATFEAPSTPPYEDTATVTLYTQDLRYANGNSLNLKSDSISISFLIDTKKPIITGPNSGLLWTINAASRQLTKTIVYNEPMNQSSAPTLSFNPLTVGDDLVRNGSSKWVSSKKYELIYDYDQTAIEQIENIGAFVSGATDVAGNFQDGLSFTLVIDTKAPTAAITYDDTDARVRGSQELLITATLSERIQFLPPSTALEITITAENNELSSDNMTQVNNREYTYRFTVPSDVNGAASITLSGVQDMRGNPIQPEPTAGATFFIDNTAPSVSTLSPANNATNVPVGTALSIRFDEEVRQVQNKQITLYRRGEDEDVIVERFSTTSSTDGARQLSFQPTGGLMEGEEYYVVIPSDALVDLVGNEFGGFSPPGSSEPSWRFVTFSPPIITGVALRDEDAAAACIDSTVVITGKFLTGVTEVRFGDTAGEGIARGEDLTLSGDTTLSVVVPGGANSGNLHLTKEAAGSNPEVTVETEGYSITVGPSSAQLGPGSQTIAAVCSSGDTTMTFVKVTIMGGEGDYEVRYSIRGNTTTESETEKDYSGGDDIRVMPHENNVNHTISLDSVKDSNGCFVPTNSLSGEFGVRRNELPVILAGGTPDSDGNKRAEICLGDNQSTITLDAATLGIPPSWEETTATASVRWMVALGGGDFIDATAMHPTYRLTNGDIWKRQVKFDVKVDNPPGGCNSTSDALTVNFASQPVVDAGGELGVLNHCWDGNSQPEVSLSGTISGATGYRWASEGEGVFGDTTASSTFYQFSPEEENQGSAKVWLRVAAGSAKCGVADQDAILPSDTLEIKLIPLPAPSLKNSKSRVCKGETATYEIENPDGRSSFTWEISDGGGEVISENNMRNSSVEIKWSNEAEKYGVSVKETDAHGCEGTGSDTITVIRSDNPGIKGSVFSFAKERKEPVELVGNSPGGEVGNMEFSGEGVFTVTKEDSETKKYYFDPGNFWNQKIGKDNSDSPPIESVITYRYGFTDVGCYSESKEQIFSVYNGSRAFYLVDSASGGSIKLNSNDEYEICRNQKVEIRIDSNFIKKAKPLQKGHYFKGFTLDLPENAILTGLPSPFVNYSDSEIPQGNTKADTVAHALAWKVVLDPKVLYEADEGDTALVKNIEINGWEYGQNDDESEPSVKGYGKVNIVVNDLRGLSYNRDEISSELCSAGEKIKLTRNEIDNPGGSYRFFLDTVASGSNVDNLVISEGEGTAKTFSLNPGVEGLFPDEDTYPSPAEILIRYEYTDGNGCTSTTSDEKSIKAKITKTPPKPILDGEKFVLCAVDSIPTAKVDNVVRVKKGTDSVNATVKWYSSNTLNSDNLLKEATEYKPSGEDIDLNKNGLTSYYVNQELNGCVSSTLEVKYEVLNTPVFSWNKSCLGGKTEVNVELGNIDKKELTWKVVEGDDTTSFTSTDQNSFEHSFDRVGQNEIQMKITTKNNCEASLTQPVTVLNSISINSTRLITFDDGDGKFVALAASLDSVSSWEHGELKENKLNRPSTPQEGGDSKVWATGLDTIPYGKGERSYLYAGCINLRDTKSPLLTFDSWVNVPQGTDGAVLQYSVDGKIVSDPTKVWKAVGNVGEGINWYNRTLIESSPNTIVDNFGWSSADTVWKSSKQSLQQVKDDQSVSGHVPIFRFVFAANEGGIEKTMGGFALDNFRLGEKTRVVLLENFTNKSKLASRIEERGQSIYFKQFHSTGIGTQLVKINYHVSFPLPDPFNLDNPGAPGARALYYGITRTPTTVLDGSIPPDDDNDGKADPFSRWGERETNKRSLEPGKADIDIEIMPSDSVSQGGVGIRVFVSAKENLEDAKLYIAILEKEISKEDLPPEKEKILAVGSDTEELEYVFKEMLPSSYGLQIGDLMQSSGSEKYEYGPYEWYPNSTKIYSDNLAIVAFLQNDKTKTVYQAAYKDKISLPDVITATADESSLVDYIRVYPNPADKNIRIVLPYQAQSDTYVYLTEMMGRTIKKILVPKGKTTLQLDTRLLAEGVYMLKIESEEGNSLHKRITIDHDDR